MNRIFILNNLQNTNIARKQMLLLKDNNNINKLEKIQREIEY